MKTQKIIVRLDRLVEPGPNKYTVMSCGSTPGFPWFGSVWLANRPDTVIPQLTHAQIEGWVQRNLGVVAGEIEFVGCDPVA